MAAEMLRFLLLQCFIYSVILVTCSGNYPPNNDDKCGRNEEFRRCGSGCDDRTCENRNNRDIACPAVCIDGCFCKGGFVRDREGGSCIPVDRCPKDKCRPNEEFRRCGSACDNRTCENRNNRDIGCAAVCVEGCFCKGGFVRDREGGACIRVDRCPKEPCGPNQQYLECGTACPETCDNYGKPRPCTYQCVQGCFCKAGFVRNDYGVCVRPETCVKAIRAASAPKPCGKDERFYDCTPSCKDTCKNYNNPGIDCGCGPPGCFCREGLVKNEDNGKCVKPEHCPGSPPGTCKDDEQFYGNMPDCWNTCENFGNPAVMCQVGRSGCFCKEELVKRKDGKCVRFEDCNKECGFNEKFSTCVVPCNDCRIKGNCFFTACNKGCDCIRDHFRNKEGICIPEEICAE